jgi:hypothetical protein
MLVALSLIVAALTQPGNPEDGYRLATRAFKKTYTSYADRNVVAQTLPWGDAEENPPISARQALKLADKMLRSIAEAPDGWKWKATNLNLLIGENPAFWSVTYQAIPIDQNTEMGPEPHIITLMVLMDGTAIKPVVTDVGDDAPPPPAD